MKGILKQGHDVDMKQSAHHPDVAAARAGNEAELAALIAREMPLINRLARRARGPGLDFDDAVQEGLIGLFYAVKNYDSDNAASFSTYAAVCIQNSIFSAQKAAGRKKHQPLNQSVPLAEEQSTPGPEEQTIRKEQLHIALEKARTRLSPLEREVLRLYLKDFTYEEIARILGRTPKTVDNALARLRRKLK